MHILTTLTRVDRMVTITDLAIMDLAHQIVDRDRMVTITDLAIMDRDPIIIWETLDAILI